MLDRRQFVAGSTAVLLAGCAKKQVLGFDGYAFVANGDDRRISVVDLSSFSVAKHILLPDSPAEVLANLSPEPVIYALAPSSGYVYEIHGERLEITRRISVGSPALSMRLSPEKSKVWVLCSDRKLVTVDLGSFRIQGQVALPQTPVDFDVSAAGDFAAISYGSIGFVSQVDLTAGRAGPMRKVADAVGTVRYRRDGKSVLLANTSGRMLTVLDAASGQVVTHLPLALRPDQFCFNQNGGQLFITGEGRDAVVVVYPYYVPQVAETVLAGPAPGVMAASSTLLFVANPKSSGVSILSIQRRKVIAVAAVGAEPGYIAITPDDQYALILNRESGDMSVLRTATITRSRTKSAALFWIVPVGSKPVSAAVVQSV